MPFLQYNVRAKKIPSRTGLAPSGGQVQSHKMVALYNPESHSNVKNLGIPQPIYFKSTKQQWVRLRPCWIATKVSNPEPPEPTVARALRCCDNVTRTIPGWKGSHQCHTPGHSSIRPLNPSASGPTRRRWRCRQPWGKRRGALFGAGRRRRRRCRRGMRQSRLATGPQAGPDSISPTLASTLAKNNGTTKTKAKFRSMQCTGTMSRRWKIPAFHQSVNCWQADEADLTKKVRQK